MAASRWICRCDLQPVTGISHSLSRTPWLEHLGSLGGPCQGYLPGLSRHKLLQKKIKSDTSLKQRKTYSKWQLNESHPPAPGLSILCHTLLYPCVKVPVLCADDWQAELTLLIHIGVVDPGFELYCRRLVWILTWKIYLNPEGPFIVWRIILGIRTETSMIHRRLRNALFLADQTKIKDVRLSLNGEYVKPFSTCNPLPLK